MAQNVQSSSGKITKNTVTSGNISTTSYVVTDNTGASATIAVSQTPGGVTTMAFSSSGGLHSDGQLAMRVLLGQLTTGLNP